MHFIFVTTGCTHGYGNLTLSGLWESEKNISINKVQIIYLHKMHIAAYLILENQYGIENQTINFGGQYLYNFIVEQELKIRIEKTLNEKYIPNFYSDTGKLTQVSAIVGRNGTGKTSLIKSITDHLGGYSIQTIGYLLIEDGNSFIIYDSKMNDVTEEFYFTNSEQNNSVKNIKINSIYYSPYLDFKDKIGDIDISLDKILTDDLEDYNNLNHHAHFVNPIKQNEFNSFKRQLEMQEFKKINEALSKSFGLPKPKNIKISFSRPADIFRNDNQTKFKFHNTPMNFQTVLDLILKKISDEQMIRRDNKKGWQKKFIKEFILMDIVTLLVDVMEGQATYLREGEFGNSFLDLVKDFTAFDTFICFVNNHFYETPFDNKKGKTVLPVNPLPKKEIKELLYKLNSVVDNLQINDDYDRSRLDVENRCIYPETGDVLAILELEIKLIEKLKIYYQIAIKNDKKIPSIASFLNYEWYDRTPSSGENSIFNLFSKLFTIKKTIEESDANYFLLFLDEGDAGFHPEWKKKYVEIITKVIPLLFDKKNVQFQIIFTTHDPFSLSDVLNYNIVYLNKKEDDIHKILSINDDDRPKKSFAANITDLLSDSFFIDDGLIGDFSKRKIEETIKWLNSKKKIDYDNYYEKLIKNIDEPIVQRKLSEMYDEKMNTDTEIRIIDEQINKLRERQQNLKVK